MGRLSTEMRLKVGEEIYTKKLSKEEAAAKYNINIYTARDYYRLYKKTVAKDIPEKTGKYDGCTREELINRILELEVEKALDHGLKPVEVVHSLKDDFQITSLCRAAGISKAWYYKWVSDKFS